MNANLKTIKNKNAKIRAENASLTRECAELRRQVLESEEKVTQIEQYPRNKNLEITGVPYCDGENLPDMLAINGTAIKEPIGAADIDVCHRVPTKNKTYSNIIVQLQNQTTRDAVLEKARKSSLSTTDIGFPKPAAAVYVTEHLCPELKTLPGRTVARKKEKNWRYAWTKGGKIFARKTDSSRTLSCLPR
ncbi:hypothetical protein HPB48_010662 [Haemaphysalis longicornis]|uniref:FP protein C-terminal domain-containing protein n=1 Tax=Haemaphysalis longicornis TaxID=44386 RepID=A0A9J6GKV2_HAELO|nr:hypothetical protein HPB48_010662 [Haemaphysalis longicornis]